MSKSPKDNETKMLMVLNAWKDLAPDKKFGGKSIADYELQVEKSLAPRRNLIKIKSEEIQEITMRGDEDGVTMADVALIVAGVIADPTEGPDSALYEMMGYIRKSMRASGLTRKKKTSKN